MNDNPPARPAPPALDLEAIQARLEAITAAMEFELSYGCIIKVYAPSPVPYKVNCLTEADKIFLEYAQSDIRALVAEVERLRMKCDEARSYLDPETRFYVFGEDPSDHT